MLQHHFDDPPENEPSLPDAENPEKEEQVREAISYIVENWRKSRDGDIVARANFEWMRDLMQRLHDGFNSISQGIGEDTDCDMFRAYYSAWEKKDFAQVLTESENQIQRFPS